MRIKMQKGESKQFIILIAEPVKLGKHMMEELMRKGDMKLGNIKQEHTQHKIQTIARSMQLPSMNLQLTIKDSKLIDRRKFTILSRSKSPSTTAKSR